MSLIELFLIGVGLSMDAFAVAIGKGLSMKRLNLRHALVIALFFGGFQALMPVIGWILGAQFSHYVEVIDHWIAFGLLALIGGKMIWDALHDEDDASKCVELEGRETAEGAPAEKTDSNLDMRELLMLAIATSIDALAMGVTFAFLQVDIASAAALIGVTTFALSLIGVWIGHQFGTRWEKPSTIAGGIVLIGIGVRILVEHLLG